MQVVAKVFHNQTREDRFFRFDASTSALVHAHDVTVEGQDTDALLAQVYRASNRVDGSDIEQVPDDCRSLSVGDVVVVNDQPYACDSLGWTRVSVLQFRDALARGILVLQGKEAK